GDYRMALKSCEAVLKTDKSDLDDRVAKEAEKFNLKLITDGKFKDQLYFWLGVLNYKQKRNYPQALEYFEIFLERATPPMRDLSAKANQYVQEIKNEIGI
ncbi:MAG TPA: hypothetical protein VN086_02810, partial [Candidatus Paceibacterota bacterium]|nr:hypothetical protein [Candidatus Paceibacterota bacterium]